MISTPGGKVASNQIINNAPLKLGSKTIPTNLILLPLEGMDVILGMDWMNKHGVLLDTLPEPLKLILLPMATQFYIYLIQNMSILVLTP